MKNSFVTKSLTNLQRYSNIAFVLIFVVVTFWLLGIDGANYLRKIELLSIFLSTKDYFNDCMAYPGGMLVWCATFLTQTFYYPWLGAIIYILILVPMAWLTLLSFKLRRSLFPSTLLLPSIILWALLNFGYIIFSLKTPGFAFILPLAINICLLAFWGYSNIHNWIVRVITLTIITIVGYCMMGFYGILLTSMCTIYEIVFMLQNPKSNFPKSIILIAIGIGGIVLIPKLWFSIIGGDLPIVQIYRYPLPFFYENESNMWIPYILLVLLMLIGCGFAAVHNAAVHNKDKNVKIEYKHASVISALIGIIAISGIFLLRYYDRNFRLTLDLDNALVHERWEEILDIISKNQDIEPTRVNVVLTDIALQRLNRAPYQIFKTRIGSSPYNTTRDLRATHDIVSMPLAYHMGLTNYAYRWATEYEVEYGRSIERLKYMVKSALLNKDFDLARKSLDNLSKTLFHKKWTEKYYSYLENPELIKDDTELGSIMPLIVYEDKFLDDNNQLEGYVWKTLASIEKGQFRALELSLTSALICFQPQLFAEAVPIYAQNVKELPLHFQEGILMWSLINHNDFYQSFKIDKSVMQRFELFKRMFHQTSSMPTEARKEKMCQMFGDTYWYYCMFVSDMKVI